MKAEILLWYKRDCSTCKNTRDMLCDFSTEEFHYLEEKLTKKKLLDLLRLLQIPASGLVRKKEKLYREKYEGKKMTEAAWIKAFLEHPVLIERPIIIYGDRAVIGRPPEKAWDILPRRGMNKS